MRRTVASVAGAVAVAALPLLCVSCASHPWWYRSGESSCGPLMQYRVHAKVSFLGGCAGQLVEPPPVVRLRPGDKLDLHVTKERGATPYLPPLAWSSLDLLRQSARDEATGTVTFTAVHEGEADLLVHTGSCINRATSRPVSGECHALHVVVQG